MTDYSHSLIIHIKINNSDPICAIDLDQDLLLFGTMLGYCGYYLIKSKEMKIISEIEDEHIFAVQILKDKLSLGVGDEKLIIIEKNINKYKDCIIKEIQNYDDDGDHYKKCENMFCMLKNEFLFLIELNIPKDDEKSVDIRLAKWKIKNWNNNGTIEGNLKISNFWVPFDFDGKLLIYIDFYEKMEKVLKIYSFKDRKFILEKKINDKEDEDYLGHISHIKKLKDERLFLVHSYKLCQIRDLKFNLIKEFEHSGKEIIACDINYNEKDELEIILLDLNCCIFYYLEKDGKEYYLFNLDKLNDITREIKDQKFFSMGYPYFIKKYKKYVAVSADQGLFLFKKI